MSTHSVYVYSLFYSAVGIELLKEQHYCGAFIKATIKPPPQPQISRGGSFFYGGGSKWDTLGGCHYAAAIEALDDRNSLRQTKRWTASSHKVPALRRRLENRRVLSLLCIRKGEQRRVQQLTGRMSDHWDGLTLDRSAVGQLSSISSRTKWQPGELYSISPADNRCHFVLLDNYESC